LRKNYFASPRERARERGILLNIPSPQCGRGKNLLMSEFTNSRGIKIRF